MPAHPVSPRPSSASPALTAAALAALALAGLAAPARAGEVAAAPADPADPAPPAGEAGEDGGEVIVVTGTRLRGELNVEQPPIAELREADIAALGAGSIGEVIEALAPATGSAARGSRGGGEPVFLLNGIRIASPREFRNYPPEAVAKIEVFPEEVAQKFGYSADQRVVNIILKPDFRMWTADGEYEQPAAGGYSRTEQGIGYLRVGEAGRTNLSLKTTDTSLLTEAERGLGDPATARYRSLVADSFGLDVTGNYARAFQSSGTTVSASAAYSRNQSRSLSGLADDGATGLERHVRSDSVSAGGVVNGRVGAFLGTLTSDGVLALGETESDRPDGTAPDVARTRTLTFVNKATLTGSLFDLPAGEVGTTFDMGFDWKRYASDDSRSGTAIAVVRRRLSAGTTLSIPLASRGGAWGDAVGTLGLTVSAGAENLSDFGTLGNWSAGAIWGPSERLSLSATRIVREVAPSISQLGNPLVADYNVPLYDPQTGTTVAATVLSGGNPALLAETQQDWKFAANWDLPFWKDARLQVDYGINTSRDVTATPGYSAAFEAAFPGRVTRGADGALQAVDLRPVTLAATRSEILGIGLSARGTIGKAPEGRGGAGPGGAGGPGGGGAPRLPGRGGFGPMGGDPSDTRVRYFAGFNYSHAFANTVRLAAAGPVFDQLAGEVLSGGTVPRDSATLEGGLFWKGFGVRASGRYTGTARLASGSGADAAMLTFGALATLDVRLFADLGQVLHRDGGWAKGLRLSLVADNLFDGQRRVVDANGVTPDAYAPDRLDPTGRYLGIDLRKAF